MKIALVNFTAWARLIFKWSEVCPDCKKWHLCSLKC